MDRESNYTERTFFQGQPTGTGFEGRRAEIIHPTIAEVPSRVNEAINILRGNIQLSGSNIKAIAITSALANEGKSSIAFRFAKSMAGLGKKTIFIDSDIRNSIIQSRYGIVGKKKGLSEYLCGSISKDKIIYRTDDNCLDMIFTGALAPNPSELVSGPLFQELMEYVRGLYDYVIVDTCPLNLVIDGLLVAKQCDGTVLVVESGKNRPRSGRKSQAADAVCGHTNPRSRSKQSSGT